MPGWFRDRAATLFRLKWGETADDRLADVTELPGRAEVEPAEVPQEPPRRGPGRPRKEEPVDFFESLREYSSTEWQWLMLYCYRLQPVTDRKAGGNPNVYIRKYAEPVDEETIKTDPACGSGMYRLVLTKAAPGSQKSKEISRHEFRILDPKYPPSVPAGEWMDDPRNKEWAWAKPNANGTAGTGDSNTVLAATLQTLLNEVLRGRKENNPASIDQSFSKIM